METNIVFVHNVYNRPKTLMHTMDIEKQFFPNSKIIVAYNNKTAIKIGNFKRLSYFEDIDFVFYPEHTHKIGCANGFILGLQKASKYNANVVIFSHDDVSINGDYIDIFKGNVEKITNGEYDVICRTPSANYGSNYYMMEGVFMNNTKVSEIVNLRKRFLKEETLPSDVRGSISPEVFLYNLLNKRDLKIKVIPYDNTSNNYNKLLGTTMGFTHKNIGLRGWKE